MGAAVTLRRLRTPLAVALLLAAAAAFVGWSQLQGYLWTDYEAEAELPLRHLAAGQLALFAQTAPGYGGSFVIRAPFALLPDLWGGGDLAIYRSMAVPCLLAGVALGWMLWRERVGRLGARGSWALAFGLLAAANPITFKALTIGHPEELLGGALCAGAVLAALHRRPWLAAVLLGLAVGNKLWAVLAIGPVFVALDGDLRLRLRTLVVAGVIAAAVMAPFALSGAAAARVAATAGHTSTIFQPWQAWWPLGETGSVVKGSDGHVKPGYRTPPAWLGPVSHPLIAALVLPFTLLWMVRRRGARAGDRSDVLLLLALLLLARCVLDPWDTGYYHLPFLLALLAWEARRGAGPPVISLAAASAVYVTFERLPVALSPDAQCAVYLAWTVPLLAALGWACFFRRPAAARLPHPAAVAA